MNYVEWLVGALTAGIALCAFLLARFNRPADLVKLEGRDATKLTPHVAPKPEIKITFHEIQSIASTSFENPRDKAFREAVEEKYGPTDKHFYSKVAGASHDNSDGTSRRVIIASCREGELLQLIREPNNPHHSNAIAICRDNGSQLGYVQRRLADEIVRDTNLHGQRWFMILSNHNRHPDTNQIVGANLYVLCLAKVPAL